MRWLVLVLGRCGFIGAGLEAEFTWALLPAGCLPGEAGFYLSSLFSALHLLRHFPAARGRLAARDPDALALYGGLPSASASSIGNGSLGEGLIRVALPDEASGSIAYEAFPAIAQLTTAHLSRLIAHKLGVTNPEDHGLYLLLDGSVFSSSPSPGSLRREVQVRDVPGGQRDPGCNQGAAGTEASPLRLQTTRRPHRMAKGSSLLLYLPPRSPSNPFGYRSPCPHGPPPPHSRKSLSSKLSKFVFIFWGRVVQAQAPG